MAQGNLTSHLNIVTTEEMRERLDAEADKRNIKVSALAREFIREGLDRRELDRRVIERIIRELGVREKGTNNE